jgi:predicted molibdopterin-dependent oxidoreductase YjgC
MITNQKQLVNHNKKFLDAFIDLKVAGWDSYVDAFNSYTMNFYKDQMSTMTETVKRTAIIMKGEANGK